MPENEDEWKEELKGFIENFLVLEHGMAFMFT